MEATLSQTQRNFVNNTKATAETLIECLNGISENAEAISTALEILNENLDEIRTLYREIGSVGFDDYDNINIIKGLLTSMSLCSIPNIDANTMIELALNAKDVSEKVSSLIDDIVNQFDDYCITKGEAESEDC